MRRKNIISLVVTLGLLLGACSTDRAASEEYQEMEQRLADSQQALAEVTAERDSLAALESPNRYVKALANQQEVEDILDDPRSYGSEEEVAELLASYATRDAVMDDAVFGAIPIRNAWYNTLYRGAMDSEIDIYHRWLSEDGSQGGALWVWHGTNQVGNPFEVYGIALDEYDETGLITSEYVAYAHSNEYVEQAVLGNGNESSAEEVASDDMFVFGEDDLCTWISEDEVTEFAREAYGDVGMDWNGNATLIREHWFEEPLDYECEWRLSESDGSIYVYTQPASRGLLIAYTDLRQPSIPMAGTVTEHPALEDEVRIKNHAFGRFGFWVPASDDQMVLSVDLGVDFDSDENRWEIPIFVVANGFLEKMNWTS